MIELEKLLNILYRGVPVDKQALLSICAFSFSDSIEAKKNIFMLLDDLSRSSGNAIINHITIYKLEDRYRLKLLINNVIE